MLYKKVAVFLALFSVFLNMSSQKTESCLIFSGESGNELSISLEKYSRIYFEENGMRISNPESPADFVKVLYSEYNKFRVGESTPTSGVENLSADGPHINYNPEGKYVKMTGADDSVFHIGIFDMNGIMLINRDVRCGEEISVADLKNGIYVVVSLSEGMKKETLKIMKK